MRHLACKKRMLKQMLKASKKWMARKDIKRDRACKVRMLNAALLAKTLLEKTNAESGKQRTIA